MTPRRATPTTTAEFRAASAATMLEDALLKNVLDAAKKLGWLTAHFRPAMTTKGWRTAVSGDGKGFPDLVLANERMGELIFVELKSSIGEVAPEQAAWLCALRAAGQRAYVWRPADLQSGYILRVLQGLA